MPTTIGNYTYDIYDGDFTIPRLIAKPRRTYPLEADPSAYFQEEDYSQFIEYYEPLQPAEAHPDYPGLYFISDSPVRDVGNGVGTWTRRWAVVPGYDENGKKPGYVYSIYESYVYTVPGITSTQELYLVNYVGSYAISSGNHVITSTLAHDIDGANKGVMILYAVIDPINGFTYYRQQVKLSKAGTAGSTLVVGEIKDINTVIPISFQRASSNQDPRQVTVMSRVDRDYWLAGVSGINSPDDIPIIDEQIIIDNSTGNRTELLSDGIPGSNPTLDEWRAFVEAKTWIVAEPSIIRRWMGSEIYERTTRYVRAKL